MSSRLPATRHSLTALAAAVSVLIAIVASAGAFLGHRTEHHAYAGGAAPAAVQVTAGHTYRLSVPGGVSKAERTESISGVACTFTRSGVAGAVALTTYPEDDTTKATNVIATFIAPVGGRIVITCAGLASVYVDDADDSGFDWATLLLVLASLAALVFVGTASSLLWTARARPAVPRHSTAA